MANKNEINAKNTAFYMVDMLNDFVFSDGKLYVSKAETLVEKVRVLNVYALQNKMRLMAGKDRHFYSDKEISETPNWSTTFPAHCMDKTYGAMTAEGLHVPDALVLEHKINEAGDIQHYSPARLEMLVKENRNIIFEKQANDVASNPYFAHAIETIKREGVENVIVYGVATDFCVKDAVKSFLNQGLKVTVVADAITGIFPDKCETTLADFKTRGVDLINTADIERYIQKKAVVAPEYSLVEPACAAGS